MQARPPRISRRRLLQATGGGVLAASAGAGVWAWLAPEDLLTRSAQGARTGRSVAAAPDPAFLHVIAHADDGLYFMNPDLEQSVRSGGRSVTVCLTGGESDGHNVGEETLDPASVPQDRAAFSRARVNGLRAAHAVMATGAPDSPWDIEAVSLLPGFQVEVQTLRAAPQNQLIFLGLVEARAVWAPRATSLRGLWLGASDTLPTLRAAGTPVQWPFHYTREQVVRTLVAVLERVGPSVVRTLDPNAVHEPHQPEDGPDFHLAGTDPRLTGLRYYDHQDHTASAYFVQAALARYWGRGHRRPTLVESYLGYEVAALPAGLDTAAARRKGDLLSVYGWADNRDCGDPAGCGDRKVGGSAFSGGSSGWTRSTRLRAPGSNGWIRPARDGRLVAFAVLDGRACCWTETDVGSGSFGGPVSVGGELLQGQIQVVRHPDGTLQLFACRTVLPGRNAAHRRELMTARQRGTSADGSPGLRAVGVARLARPGSGQVAGDRLPGGGGGPERHGACLRTDLGRRHRLPQRPARHAVGAVAAAGGPGRLTHRRHRRSSTDWTPASTPRGWCIWSHRPRERCTTGCRRRPVRFRSLPLPPACRKRAARSVSSALGNGAVRMTYRRPDTAQVLIADWRRPAGGWRVTARCPVVGGHGRVAAAPVGRGDRMVLAVRDAAGEVRVAMAQEGPRPWQQGKVPHSGAAGVAVDAEGRAVVVALGHDGCLYAARQRAAGKSGRFVGWRAQAGSSDRAADGGAA